MEFSEKRIQSKIVSEQSKRPLGIDIKFCNDRQHVPINRRINVANSTGTEQIEAEHTESQSMANVATYTPAHS